MYKNDENPLCNGGTLSAGIACPISLCQDTHLLPSLPQSSDANKSPRLSLYILHVEKLVFLPKGKEVSKEGVEVRLGAKMQDLGVMRVVEVCKHAEELSINVFCR